MRTSTKIMQTPITLLSLVAIVLSLVVPIATARAQGTALTYQGRLNDAAGPASGIYDLRFAIYDLLAGGTQQGGQTTNTGTVVSKGPCSVIGGFRVLPVAGQSVSSPLLTIVPATPPTRFYHLRVVP